MATLSIFPCKCTNLLHVYPLKRSQAFTFDPLGNIPNSRLRDGFLFPGNHITGRGRQMNKRSKKNLTVCCRTPEERNHFSSVLAYLGSWLNWLPGMLQALTPLLTQRFLTITRNVETTVETVEKLADDVEEVGEDVEKVAEDIEKKLPAGGGKLKEMVEEVDQKVESFIPNQSEERH